jgi:peptide methionine sulfoxide reductase MsrA
MNDSENIHKSYFASGCFWGTEYWFMKALGVKATTVGSQYLSCIFYTNPEEKAIAGNYVQRLEETGYEIDSLTHTCLYPIPLFPMELYLQCRIP